MRVVRWIIVAVGVLAILGGVMQLLTPTRDATTINQETGGSVKQADIDQFDSNQKLISVGLITFWIFVIAITMYFEQKSVKKSKLNNEKTSSTKK